MTSIHCFNQLISMPLLMGKIKQPTHYAAKNDAVRSLKVLLKLGGRVHDRDYKKRTPLQVAAELGMLLRLLY